MFIRHTKLFETILAMTLSERDSIPNFILSPAFFTKEEKILELYVLLRREVEKEERGEAIIEIEEEIYKLLSPEHSWQKRTFDSMKSRLLSVIKKAIIYQNTGVDKSNADITEAEAHSMEIKQLIYLSQFYRERKLHQQFDNTMNRLKVLHNYIPLSSDHYHTDYLVNNEAYSAACLYRTPERNTKRIETQDSLDVYYIVNKLSLLIQVEPSIKEEIVPQLELLENLNTTKNPIFCRIIDIYKTAFALIWHKEGDDGSILEHYLEVLDDDAYLLPLEDQKNCYTRARNFCTFKYKNGQRRYLDILFKLIRKNLKAGLLYHRDGVKTDGILHSSVQNIVAIALRLEKSDWALKFLEDHKTKIIAPTPAEQQRFYHFNMACYHFQLEEYDEALFLLRMDFDDERYRLAARALEIKLYFEKPNKSEVEIEHLEKRIAAFEAFLVRTVVGELDQMGYRNFIKFVKKLTKLKSILPSELEEKNKIAEREWIIEKIEIMEAEKKAMTMGSWRAKKKTRQFVIEEKASFP